MNSSPDLIELFQKADLRQVRRYLTMGRCSILTAARLTWDSPNNQTPRQDATDFHETLQYCRSNCKGLDSVLSGELNGCELLASRLALILAVIGDYNESKMTERIDRFARAIDTAWQCSWMRSKPPADNCRASFKFIDKRHGRNSPLPNLDRAFRAVAEVYWLGWSHPGLLMAGDLIAEILGCRRPPELSVCTKLLLAAHVPQDPMGLLAELTVERIPDGTGQMIPDAYLCGYLHMKPSFSQGLWNAWQAALQYAERNFKPSKHSFDWRWSLDLLFATSRLPTKPAMVQLEGHSAEVAIACALIAAHPDNPDNQDGNNPLDAHVGTTARFSEDATTDQEIVGVTDIKVKTLVDRLQVERILEIVIAAGQDPAEMPKPTEDARFEYREARNLAEAYKYMTRHPRITRGLNKYFAQWAAGHLQRQCTPWVMPELKEVIEHHAQQSRVGHDVDLRSADTVDLKDDIESLVTGRLAIYDSPHFYSDDRSQIVSDLDAVNHPKPWRGNRVRIFADSGLGKSMFMLYCQHRISSSNDTLLPLRIGRTTYEDAALDIHWNQPRKEDVIQKLVELPSVSQAFDAFATSADGKNKLTPAHRYDWFHWMLRKGRVVFLIDALDQAGTAVRGLGSFLGSQDVRHCPVVVAGRPETLTTRSDAFVENYPWRTLRVEPFDRRRKTEYLGSELANQLLLPEVKDLPRSQPDWRSDDDELRRFQWRDLLEIPLLLSLVKLLATSDSRGRYLKDIHSRFELYDLAVDELIEKGFKTANDDQRKLLGEGSDVRELLGKLAWFMLHRHDFSIVLEGKAYSDFCKALQLDSSSSKRVTDITGLMNAMVQVDITTAFQVLDRADSSGLAFRHRSFAEFFAACHLMDRRILSSNLDVGEIEYADRVPMTVRHRLLAEIHEVTDEQGNILLDRMDRQANWQETLRFALGHSTQRESANRLAIELIEHGNPWVVYQAIKRDRISLSSGIESLCRWLVHCDSPLWFEFRDAVVESAQNSDETREVSQKQLAEVNVNKMLERNLRDAAYLYPLQLLVGRKWVHGEPNAEAILKERLGSLPIKEIGCETWDFEASFVFVPGGTLPMRTIHPNIGRDDIAIDAFELADFPVTNSLFELFCPSHFRQRSQYSLEPDQPVVNVSWYMADQFCAWLTGLTGRTHRLPTEWEWEWACRWPLRQQQAAIWRASYWWGDSIDRTRCWCIETSNNQGTRSRTAARAAFSIREFAHPSWCDLHRCGLLDMHGNVWEWCANWFDNLMTSRSLRGGSWDFHQTLCSSASRNHFDPVFRFNSLGFRVCRE